MTHINPIIHNDSPPYVLISSPENATINPIIISSSPRNVRKNESAFNPLGN